MKRPQRYAAPSARPKAERDAAYDDRRGSAHERGYDHRWRKARLLHLASEPLCRMCANASPPSIVVATVVDHIVEHKGDARLFWDPHNWQSLCKSCHDGAKQSLERGRKVGGG